jgi:PAS domain-containing protein
MAESSPSKLAKNPGPPHVTAQGQGGKSWNMHMGPTALRSTESTESWHHFPYRAQAPVISYHRNQIQIISVIELTELKTSEEELRESEGRYRAVVEQAAEGIVLFDVGCKRVLEANIPDQNLFGYTLEAILRRAALRSRFVLPGFPQIPLTYAESARVTDGTRTRDLRSHNPTTSVAKSC